MLKPAIVPRAVTPQVFPRHNWSPVHLWQFCCHIDGRQDQAWQTMTATDGPALPEVVPFVLFNAIINDS